MPRPNLPDTGILGYQPLARAWICDAHGQPDCDVTERCRVLPWEATRDPALWPFIRWCDEQFDKLVAPMDRGEVDELPDEACDAYWPAGWHADA